jgi:hypothetical protein
MEGYRVVCLGRAIICRILGRVEYYVILISKVKYLLIFNMVNNAVN